MKLSVHLARQALLAASLIAYLLIIADNYLLPFQKHPAFVSYHWGNSSGSYNYNFTTIFPGHVKESALKVWNNTELKTGQSCQLYYTQLFRKVAFISTKNDQNVDEYYNTGMFSDGFFMTGFLTLINVFAGILFFTKWLDKYSGSVFGPFVIGLFNLIILLLYFAED